VGTSVLVVDNHPMILEFMKKVLEPEQCDVVTAQNGLEALVILETLVPEVVFLDLVMPYIDGRQLAAIIRSRPPLAGTCIVILSAVAAEEGADASVREADACIAKGPLPAMRQYVLSVLAGLRSGVRPHGILGLEGVYRRQISEELLRSTKHRWAIVAALREAVVELSPDFRIVSVNPAAERLFSSPGGELLATSLPAVFAEGQRSEIESLLRAAPGEALALTERTPLFVRGRRVTMDVLQVADEHEAAFVAIFDDVTVRRDAEDRLMTSLREKEILLREAYHRVKNNMQVVSSLLSLQARVSGDARFEQAVKASESRIAAITLVHEALFRAESLATIDLAAYLARLVEMLLELYGRERAEIALSLEPIEISTSLAVPCGLILNELIANALRYATPPGGRAMVRVSARTVGSGVVELAVSDGGPGLGAVQASPQGLGLQLVAGLVENQLDGMHEVSRGPGARHVIRFSIR
jgi:two-component sensor histidine kinase/DNA-binding NarL/FixJ family response regulator